MVWGRLVNLVESFLIGPNLLSRVGGCVGCYVASQEGDILEEFAELTVGDQQTSQCTQAFHSLLTVLLSLIFADGSIDVGGVWRRGGLDRVIQEVLEFFVVILFEPEVFGRIDDVAQIFNNFATFRAQLFAGVF